MRAFLGALLVTTIACSSTSPTVSAPPPVEPAPLASPPKGVSGPDAAQRNERLAERIVADTPKTTVAGNTFIAPEGWTLVVEGTATILTPPEAGSHIALVDVQAKDADAAVALAWAAYHPDKNGPSRSRPAPPIGTGGPIFATTTIRLRRTKNATSSRGRGWPTARGRS